MELDPVTQSLQNQPAPVNTILTSTASSIADELVDRDQHRNNVIIYNFLEKYVDKKAFTDLCQVAFTEQLLSLK